MELVPRGWERMGKWSARDMVVPEFVAVFQDGREVKDMIERRRGTAGVAGKGGAVRSRLYVGENGRVLDFSCWPDHSNAYQPLLKPRRNFGGAGVGSFERCIGIM